MAQQGIIDIFNDCIDRMATGQTIDDCLRLYPTHAPRLRPLLETGDIIRAERVSQAEMLEDQAIVWGLIGRQIPNQTGRRADGQQTVLRLMIALFILILLLAATWFVLTRPDLPPDENNVVVPVVRSVTPSPTVTASMTASVTPLEITRTLTPTLTFTHTLTVIPSPTSTPTLQPSSTFPPTVTTLPSRTPVITQTIPLPTATFAPGCGAPLTEQDAINRVMEIYPNTKVTSIVQESRFGGTLVWVVQTSHQIEVTISVACGDIFTIEQMGDNNEVTPIQDNNANVNTNDNSSESIANTNSADNSNDNSDDSGDDNSGMGSDD